MKRTIWHNIDVIATLVALVYIMAANAPVGLYS